MVEFWHLWYSLNTYKFDCSVLRLPEKNSSSKSTKSTSCFIIFFDISKTTKLIKSFWKKTHGGYFPLAIEFRNSKFCVHNLEILSLDTRNFECANSKMSLETQNVQFREMSRFKTQNYELINSKFRVSKLKFSSFKTQNLVRLWKLKILSLQPWNYKLLDLKIRVSKLKILSLQTQNFAFRNSKFRVCK